MTSDQSFAELTSAIQKKRAAGHNVGRFAQALAIAKGDPLHAREFARRNFSMDSGVAVEALEQLCKGSVAAMGTTGDTAPLMLPATLASEFVGLVAPATVLGRLGVRTMPMNVKIARADEGVGAAWIGESLAIPVSKMSFTSLALSYAKAGSLVVVTNELASDSSPKAAAVIASDMARATARFVDIAFLSGAAAIANVRPAGIANGAEVFNSSGNAAADVLADVKAMIAFFTANEMPLSGSTFILSERVALEWSTLFTSAGSFLFPNLGVNGGSILGVPVLTTATALPAVNSPNEETALLIHADSIMVGDSGVTIDISGSASVEMESVPTGPVETTIMTSLFQHDLVGLRAIRFMSWAARRANAVALLNGINLA